MQGLLFGTTLLASFLGGIVALLAPCCVSVMLPAYLATGFRKRRGILAATLVFAAGVATVIVPIGLGATAITALVSGHHFAVFSLGGLAMAAGGIAVLAGWQPKLPMPAGRTPGGAAGIGPIYGLGVFSGAASSCCAPVLAGVAVLSGATASFPAALAVSATYVAGMVAPLAVIALLWDRRDWGASRLLHGRQVTLALGPLHRRIPVGMLASGLLLIGMGSLTVVIAFTGPDMGTGGWRLRLAADLQHWASVTTGWLSWLPGWAFALILTAAVAYLVRQAVRHHTRPDPLPAPESLGAAAVPESASCCEAPAPTLQTTGTTTDD
ncbi:MULTISPECIES: cytochrome c biogenesis CcdA family protein [Streptomycetaceae]|uniref:Cytochrome c biogenesis protein transmembrane region n=1 Tax=Streptantibioticus cattleyicolor (strain ATCC 35852 / DSM 46488 / JCM 4925 / NBRC 14057 / NRRL 8057) TaxID=1003195 RepID=G8X2J6_STREN|nr:MULTISPECIES: cytochrome c biogenesis protein CcdA [Streptomycetaceae]AEW95112.1 cytochrome c biogenesis protein transmembrane region [Streptantibioticus cattleyicolor NRRL 8057 = DSM 46488]MYS59701.1 cytochrome c biogenesis protein CcdA [Streptomyces sp. SID5468]